MILSVRLSLDLSWQARTCIVHAHQRMPGAAPTTPVSCTTHQQVYALWRHKVLVVRGDKLAQRLL